MFEAAGRFRDLVTDRFGLRFEDDRLPHLAALVQRRAESQHVSVERYLAEIGTNAAECSLLATELTVGETYFFRHYDQFLAFREAMVRDRSSAFRNGRPLRILSAGCSTGEEPYSLAMIIASLGPEWSNTAIIGADLNPAALQQARRARYGIWSMRETPADYMARCFTQDGREFTLDATIRDAVHLTIANFAFADDPIWQEEPFDVIFCRNVIMYFAPDVQKAVVARLGGLLVPGGHLVLGHAETLRGLSTAFELCHTHGVFYYRRGEAEPGGSIVPQPASSIARSRGSGWVTEIERASNRVAALSERRSPNSGRVQSGPIAPQIAAVLSLLAHERFEPALDLLDAMGKSSGEDQDLLELRAVILTHKGDFAASAAACRTLLARNPHNAGAYYVLALCSEGMGDDQGAIGNYDLASHVDPNFAMPVLRRALLLRRARRRDGSRADLVRAGELLSNEDAPRILLYGGGFTREALLALCASELAAFDAAA